MPTDRDNSYVDQFFNSNNPKVRNAANEIRESVALMPGPDAAKLLLAVAADIVRGIQSRNDRPDVGAAVASLQASLAVLQAIDGNLDG
jgi:hypothetical protein